MDKNISILGCGWLGLPLAMSLKRQGWQVKGSTTGEAKLPVLRANHIDPYLVQLSNGKLNAGDAFFESGILLINVPPLLKKQPAINYLMQMQALALRVGQSPVKQVVFISSTSVYPDQNTEITDVNHVDHESVLYQAEQLFSKSGDFTTTIVRFAGLIGPGRNPGRFFAGKNNIPNGKAPVNLIHQADCTGIIKSILNQQRFGETYHAAALTHPSKNEFYTLAAKVAGMPVPGFMDELQEWKTINSGMLEQALNYRFIYPDLLKINADWF